MSRPPPPWLVVRVDGGGASGLGHFVRSAAIASRWEARGGCVVVLTQRDTDLHDLIAKRSWTHETFAGPIGGAADLDRLRGLLRELGGPATILDGYELSPGYQAAALEASSRLLVVDDNAHQDRYAARWILNASPYADPRMYEERGGREATLLLGLRFAPLRDQFVTARAVAGTPTPGLVLVTLGGADPGDWLPRVVASALAARGVQRVVAVLPKGRAAPTIADPRVVWREGVEDMATVMGTAAAAVSASGTTLWELAALGVPAVTLTLVDNQARNGAWLAAHPETHWHLGSLSMDSLANIPNALTTLLEPRARAARSAVLRALVDGLGARRVVALLAGAEVWLRPATTDDAETLWRWANDDEVRQRSFSPARIPWSEHLAWLQRTLADPAQRLWIGVDNQDFAIGQVRLVRAEDHGATISVSIAAARRGRGLARALVDEACREGLSSGFAQVIDAFIKPDNAASLRAFAAAGFEPAGDLEVAGVPAKRLRRAASADARHGALAPNGDPEWH